MRALVLALLCAAVPAPAAGADLLEIYLATRGQSEGSTNVQLARAAFPPESREGLELDETTEAWLALVPKRDRPPFVLAEGEKPPKRILELESSIWRWQSSLGGSDDAAIEKLWPAQLSPAATLELKLAIERGSDRHTLLHVVTNDLESAEARHQLFERIRRASGSARSELTIVNTDVDDTLIPSLWDRGRYARGKPYPGVVELLAAQGDFLVVLTARPSLRGWMSSRTRETVLAMLGVDVADPMRVNVSVSPGAALDILDSMEMGLQKAESLLAERRLFPEARSVFDGDSGQGDWIAALILRDLDPEGFPYATLHDVRPWSKPHAAAVIAALSESARLAALYREGLGEGASPERVAEAVRAFRHTAERVLSGPNGRLDGKLLAERKIFLFRNHLDLVLDLATAGFVTADATDRVLAAAWRDTRFLRQAPFGYDRGAPERTARRIREWVAGRRNTR